jgi:hypothetical protein
MSKSCGPQTQLVSNDHLRVAQCGCGAYHVTFTKRGLSLQMGAAELRALGEAMGIVIRVADAEARPRALDSRDPN